MINRIQGARSMLAKSKTAWIATLVLLVVALLPSMPTIIPTAVAGASGWYTLITIIENSGNALYNYSVRIVLNSTNWDGWSYVSADGSDIYFLDSSGNPLYYWIESFNATAKNAVAWVKIPFVPARGYTTIYMYYGGDNPFFTHRDPRQVFIFFDDFDTLNTSVWTMSGGGSASASGGVAAVQPTDNGGWTYIRTASAINISIGATIELYNISTSPDYGGQGTLFAGLSVSAPSTKSNSTGGAFGNTARVGMGEGNSVDWGIQIETASGTSYAYSSALTTASGFSGLYIRIYWNSSMVYAEYWGAASGSVKLTSSIAPLNTTYYVLIGACDTSSGYTPPTIRVDRVVVRPYVYPEPSVSNSVSLKPPVGISSVTPTGLTVGTGDSIVFTVTVNNTLSDNVNTTVRLVDYDNVVRDEENVTVPASSALNVTLSTVATVQDIGNKTWVIRLLNSTGGSVLDVYSVWVYVFNRTVAFTYVNPTSATLQPGDVLSVGFTVNSTLNSTANIVVALVDYAGVTRGSVSTSIDPFTTFSSTISTAVTVSDHGNYTWTLVVYNANNASMVYDAKSIRVVVLINVSYSYGYTINPGSSLNATGTQGAGYGYTINPGSSLNATGTSANSNPRMQGFSATLNLYTNSTGSWVLVVQQSNATIYTLNFSFTYSYQEGASGFPDDYIYIYTVDPSTGNLSLYASLYIPGGNQYVVLPAHRQYAVSIPSSGLTTTRYFFQLVSYTVNGESSSLNLFTLDRDYYIVVNYAITKTPRDLPPVTITLVTPPSYSWGGNMSDYVPPNFQSGSPGLYTINGILLTGFFMGLFIVYARAFGWGRALVVSSSLSLIVSVILFGPNLVAFFLVLVVIGIGAWKYLGK